MKIIVDAMGGDNAPHAIVQGALDANRLHGIEIILVGRVEEILKAVEACGEKTLPAGIEIRDAREVVEICDDPATDFKKKKDSMYENKIVRDFRDGKVSKEELDACSTWENCVKVEK